MTERQQRRLAAILAADIASYSALMGADETRTVRDLKAHQAVILPMIREYGGRVIDTAGDGILAEFGSVVNAVECAVAIQKTMAERNATVEMARQMLFRIGINIGDVIHDESRVYGDGVNIAARLEGIAAPGGICVSGGVYDQIHQKLPLTFTDLGEQSVKNIATPVRTYRLELGHGHRALPRVDKIPLSLPDKPSIAVLPFTNLSGDPKEDYFSDGITEDIITELSRFSELFVIARNSSFQYKGRSPDIRQVGRELGVRYVLEGSIRRAGDRVRITGQLIDAETGAHRWAERYDRKLEDIFAVQDEVARTITALLAAHVNKAEMGRALLKPPATWQAHDYFMRGAETFSLAQSSFNADDLYLARRLLQEALSADPNYARAYVTLSNTYVVASVNEIDQDFLNPAALERAHQLARKAVQLDPNLPAAHAQLGAALIWRRCSEESISECKKAIMLNRNFSDWRFAVALLYAGELLIAIKTLEEHMRLDPFYPPLVPGWMGFAHYLQKDYSEALPWLRECTSRAPNSRAGHGWLAATYAQMGQLEKARESAAEMLRIQPKYTIEGTQRIVAVFKDPKLIEHFFDGLRKAGLPDR